MKKRNILALCIGCTCWIARAGVIAWVGGSGDAGEGANWDGGSIPTVSDEVRLGSAEATREIVVSADTRWGALTIEQIEPEEGVVTNRLTVAEGVTLSLAGQYPLMTQGAVHGVVEIFLAEGATLTFLQNGNVYPEMDEFSVLAGTGELTNNPTNAIVLTMNGTLAGPGLSLMRLNAQNRMILGPNAQVRGPQTWQIVDNHPNYIALDAQMTNPENWDNESVSYILEHGGAGSIEAMTSTENPSTESHYKFAMIKLDTSSQGQGHEYARFRNNTINDGGAEGAKEAVYALRWTSDASDSSGGHFLLDLYGQDLYVDRFSQMDRLNLKSVQFVNAAEGTTSTIRAIDVEGDTLFGGSFGVVNGATLEVVGGDWHEMIWDRNVGDAPSDASAFPDNGILRNGFDVDRTQRWDGTDAPKHAAFNHYLGSGTALGGNTKTAYPGTDGTLRIVGGGYATSGLIFNPIGAKGIIDTLSTNPAYLDDTLNDIIIRANCWQIITNISTTTGFCDAPGHRLAAGTPMRLGMNANQYEGLTNTVVYYVTDPTEDGFYLATELHGEPVIPTATASRMRVYEYNGMGNMTTLTALIAAGEMRVIGNVRMPVISGSRQVGRGYACNAPMLQPTFRVGGVVPVRTAVTVDPVNDTFTLASGTIQEGDSFWLSTTSVPAGLVNGQVYYARDVEGASFKLCLAPGEEVQDFTNAGNTVAIVTVEPAGEAELSVVGDLELEAREIECYIANYSENMYSIRVSLAEGDGSTVTVTTVSNHGLHAGDVITATGVANAAYCGEFVVTSVPTLTTFTYEAEFAGKCANALSFYYNTPASINVAIQSNAVVRVGGNLTIGGCGSIQNCARTGLGVGIAPESTIILTGEMDATQRVAVTPTVGNFVLEEGVAASLAAPLTVAGTLRLGTDASLTSGDEASGLMLCGDGIVDASAGEVEVAAVELGDAGRITFGEREDIENAFRIRGNAHASLAQAIAEGRIISGHRCLGSAYNAQGDYTYFTDAVTLIMIR